MRSVEIYRAQADVKKLTESTRPGPAIRAMAQEDGPRATPFERYAASVLREAGALELTEPGKPELRLIRSAGGELVRLSAPGALGTGAAAIAPTSPEAANSPGTPMAAGTPEPASVSAPNSGNPSVQALEDALNRLIGIVEALSCGIGAHAPGGRSYSRTRRQALFESHGMDYPLWSDTERGAHVQLPALAPGETPDFAYFNEIDWRMLDTVANNAHVFFQAAILTNMNQVIFGVKAPHSSEWDVRTRLASILGGLEPPLRFSYRFDCDTQHGTAAVRFTAPSTESFPHVGEALRLRPPAPAQDGMGNRAEIARIAYALRLSALLAAACFGAGRIIERAIVEGTSGGRAMTSCTFDRTQFVREALPIIDSGAFASPDMRYAPQRVAAMLKPARVEICPRGTAPSAANILGAMRVNPWEDERELPPDLQRFFHAKRASAIDTSHYIGSSAAIIDEAKSDSADSLAAAIAQLEDVAMSLETNLKPPDDQPDARPLYCGHALARAAVALMGDELNVAAEAESFLNPDREPLAGDLPTVYYYRAPDALFHAHVGLADLYRKLGDVRGAEAQADRCIALAPTTAAGYALKADALAGRGRYKEAANVIMGGLRTAVAENDQALLLHDLAQLFWRMGRSKEASALHIYTSSFTGIYAAKSLAFVKQIAEGDNVRWFIRENMLEAAKVIEASGIPVLQERTRQTLVTRAALGLANAHMPNIAAPFIAEVAKRFPTNRAVTQACNSIRFGTSTLARPPWHACQNSAISFT